MQNKQAKLEYKKKLPFEEREARSDDFESTEAMCVNLFNVKFVPILKSISNQKRVT